MVPEFFSHGRSFSAAIQLLNHLLDLCNVSLDAGFHETSPPHQVGFVQVPLVAKPFERMCKMIH